MLSGKSRFKNKAIHAAHFGSSIARFIALVSIALFIGFRPAPATADLIEIDLLSAGDKLITLDTDTGLEWLDVSLTANITYNAITSGAAVGGLGGLNPIVNFGFIHATPDQTGSLFLNAGIAAPNSFTTANFAPGIWDDPYIAPFIPHRLDLRDRERTFAWLREIGEEDNA